MKVTIFGVTENVVGVWFDVVQDSLTLTTVISDRFLTTSHYTE